MGTVGLGWDCIEEVSGSSGAKSIDICSTINDGNIDTVTFLWRKWDDMLEANMMLRSLGQSTTNEIRNIHALDLQRAAMR